MLFYCYSEIGDSTIESRLGDADYSYYFVLKAYLPLLEKLGETRVIEAIDEGFLADCRRETENGRQCYLLAFAPPHKIPFEIPCPTIPVFAWEYSSIPNREFISDPQDSWCYALEHFGQALTHSSYAMDVVRNDIGPDYPIESVPAPLWDNWAALRAEAPSRTPVKDLTLTLGTAVIDSKDFAINSESIAPASQVARPPGGNAGDTESCHNLDIEFGEMNPDVWMVGFYPPEGWGAWSKTTSPWIMLPSVVSGEVRLVIALNGHAGNIGKDIQVQIGDQCVTLQPQLEISEYEFELNVTQPSNFVMFKGLDTTAERSIVDPRTIAIGLARIAIESKSNPPTEAAPKLNTVEHKLKLNGVVYTSILNPRDGRKNWEDILTAYCQAFQDREDVTLILKMTYNDMSGYLEDVFALLCQLHPFKCRIVVVHGYISGAEYRALISATSYIVNASRSEGQCLPLMEYMSCGVPAITPDNTAMADYANTDNAFIVDSSPEPHYWPHDPQQVFTTLWYRPNWETLFQAYQDSYTVANTDPERYQRMSRAAWESQHAFCSSEALLPRLQSLLSRIGKE
ncbi:MAG: hypothetical protein Hals2KO_10790 [Halioglobus sp.]